VYVAHGVKTWITSKNRNDKQNHLPHDSNILWPVTTKRSDIKANNSSSTHGVTKTYTKWKRLWSGRKKIEIYWFGMQSVWP